MTTRVGGGFVGKLVARCIQQYHGVLVSAYPVYICNLDRDGRTISTSQTISGAHCVVYVINLSRFS